MGKERGRKENLEGVLLRPKEDLFEGCIVLLRLLEAQ